MSIYLLELLYQMLFLMRRHPYEVFFYITHYRLYTQDIVYEGVDNK
jgi:hypothetical protein